MLTGSGAGIISPWRPIHDYKTLNIADYLEKVIAAGAINARKGAGAYFLATFNNFQPIVIDKQDTFADYQLYYEKNCIIVHHCAVGPCVVCAEGFSSHEHHYQTQV